MMTVTFSGPAGCGKSTQIELYKKFLVENKITYSTGDYMTKARSEKFIPLCHVLIIEEQTKE